MRRDHPAVQLRDRVCPRCGVRRSSAAVRCIDARRHCYVSLCVVDRRAGSWQTSCHLGRRFAPALRMQLAAYCVVCNRGASTEMSRVHQMPMGSDAFAKARDNMNGFPCKANE